MIANPLNTNPSLADVSIADASPADRQLVRKLRARTAIAKPATYSLFLLIAIAVFATATPTRAQQTGSAGDAMLQTINTAPPASLTLEDAIQLALVKSYILRDQQLSVNEARSQVREGWGQLMPQVDASSSYTRNLKTANPFAGSQAGGLFSTLGFINWLSFNEQARTDTDGGTVPITLDDFLQRQQAGLDAINFSSDGGGNLFTVANQANATISVSQKLFDMRAIVGARGASKYLRALAEAGLKRQEQLTVDDVRRAYYGALLSQQNAAVVRQSAGRTRITRNETAQRVSQGVLPKFERLSAEVALSNLESNLVRAATQAKAAQDQLKFVIGMPVDQELNLATVLDAESDGSFVQVSVPDALQIAMDRRGDIESARLNIRLEDVQRKAAFAEYFPTIDAVFNIGYVGSVPSTRTNAIADPIDPFKFSLQSNGVFSDAYWDRTSSVGLRLNWNIFNGFQSKERLQQRKIAQQRADLQYEQLRESVKIEIQNAIRNVEASRLQISSQEVNVERAELNYQYASARLNEGVASRLEEREASDLLDQSRFSYLQAVHDYLVAKSALTTAIGTTPGVETRLNMTAADGSFGDDAAASDDQSILQVADPSDAVPDDLGRNANN